MERGSPNTVVASANVTPCLAKFASASSPRCGSCWRCSSGRHRRRPVDLDVGVRLVGGPGGGIPFGSGDRQGRIAVNDRVVAVGIRTPPRMERIRPSPMSVCSGKGSRVSATRQPSISSLRLTHTKTGLRVRARPDPRPYEAGVKISDADMKQLNLRSHRFGPEWNYTITGREN